eukprot:c7310_g1_i1.p1 GENE.c7310_g1_i1~~c7310_g1_i1.p1  ORF type:complete len:279 (-),score=54.86 c7310_g1_i1:43-879(-)
MTENINSANTTNTTNIHNISEENISKMLSWVEANHLNESVALNESSHRTTFVLDRHCVIRYLFATNQHLEKTKTMLLNTIEWRKKNQIGFYLDEPNVHQLVRRESASGKLFVAPFRSKFGHSVLVITPSRENTYQFKDAFTNLVYTLERAIWMLPSHLSSFVVMVDFKDYRLANSPPIQTVLDFALVLQNHYPERLVRVFLIDSPTLFLISFRVLKQLLTPVSQAKIIFLNTSSPDCAEMIRDYFGDPSVVYTTFGGTREFKMDIEEYMSIHKFIPVD